MSPAGATRALHAPEHQELEALEAQFEFVGEAREAQFQFVGEALEAQVHFVHPELCFADGHLTEVSPAGATRALHAREHQELKEDEAQFERRAARARAGVRSACTTPSSAACATGTWPAVCATAAHRHYPVVSRWCQRHYFFDRSLRRLQNGKNRCSDGNAPYERDALQRVRSSAVRSSAS